MKKLFTLFVLVVLGLNANAQSTGTIEVQYYVDANSNCVYNSGEQLLYNVATELTFVNSSGATVSSVYSPSFATCSSMTLWAWSYSTTATNTVSIMGSGISPNTCASYNNLPYNTNTLYYLPVTIGGTSNLGVQASINYYSSTGGYNYNNLAPGSSIGMCSNLGNDSMYVNIMVPNVMNCSGTNTLAPRTYSLFFDGVHYDHITFTGGSPSSAFNSGVNLLSSGYEYYSNAQAYLGLYPQLPTTFSVLGTHTFEVRSTMIYNNSASTVNFYWLINSVPCTKISGKFYNDCNSNCVFDGTDTYGVGYFATGKMYNAGGFNVTFSPDYNGNFSVYAPTGASYSLTQYPTFTASPYNLTPCTTGTITIPPATTTNTFMFGYQSSMASVTDPGVSIWRSASTSTVISPGVGIEFDVAFYNNWWNICAITGGNPGVLKVTLPKFINYVSTLTGPTPTVITSGSVTDTLIYAVPNFSATNWWIAPFVTFSAVVNSTAVATTVFDVGARIFPTVDASTVNNYATWHRTIGGPMDPNGKYTEAVGIKSNGDVPHGTQLFFYNIGFQNIGDAPAINVTTLDTIDPSFDLTTLEVVQSSYPVSVQKDNVSRLVGFHFKGINLPGVLTDEPGSHGFVRYAIRLKAGIPANTVLKNRGHNYFDFNEPVATNQTVNKLVATTAINEFGVIDNSVKAIPNPFGNQLKIASQREIQNVRVYNLMGALVMDISTSSLEADLDFSGLSSQIYIVKVTGTDNSISTIKVVKE